MSLHILYGFGVLGEVYFVVVSHVVIGYVVDLPVIVHIEKRIVVRSYISKALYFPVNSFDFRDNIDCCIFLYCALSLSIRDDNSSIPINELFFFDYFILQGYLLSVEHLVATTTYSGLDCLNISASPSIVD